MFRTRYIALAIIAAVMALALGACTRHDENDMPQEPCVETEEPASLTIDISTTDLGIDVSTRAGETISPAIEGSEMECLAIILVHRKQNKIVAIREFGKGVEQIIGEARPHDLTDENNGFLDANGNVDPTLKSGTRARVTFDYENPLHLSQNADNIKSTERLLRGEYRLFAIANFNHEVPTSEKSSTPSGPTDPSTPITDPTVPTDPNSPTDPTTPTTKADPATDTPVTIADNYETISLKNTLQGIISAFHAHPDTGIGDFAKEFEFFYNMRFLMNRTVKDNHVVPILDEAGNEITPFIRPAVNQTLTATQNVYLSAGKNTISVEMLRISSRTKVEVKNTSSEKLVVNSLSFCDYYTQCSNFLFRREYHKGNYDELFETYTKFDDPHRGEEGNVPLFRGAPDVSFKGRAQGQTINDLQQPEAGAITAFEPGVEVAPNSTVCIFDALMYETYSPDKPLYYTIEVSYPEAKYMTTDRTKLDPNKPIAEIEGAGGYTYAIDGTTQYLTDFTDYKSLGEMIKAYSKRTPDLGNEAYAGYFLVQGVQSGKFLREKDDGTLCAEDTAVNINWEHISSYVWRITVSPYETAYLCSLQNAYSSKFSGAIPKRASGMKSQSNAEQYTLGVITNTDTNGNITSRNASFSTEIDKVNYYLNVWADGPNMGGWDGTDGGSQFRLYPLKRLNAFEGTPLPQKKQITLTTYNDETAIVEQTHEIQRNDFVHILVEVSFNSGKGEFEFEVEPWNTTPTGNITFN